MDRPGVSRAGRGVACEEERAGERFRPVELGGVAPGDRVREAAPSVGIGTPIDEPDLGRPAANPGESERDDPEPNLVSAPGSLLRN